MNKECDREFPIWTENHQHAFDAIKALVLGAECLTMIDYEDGMKKIFVTTDASDRRTGAVLSFGETWQTACPVAYDSYQLNESMLHSPTYSGRIPARISGISGFQ